MDRPPFFSAISSDLGVVPGEARLRSTYRVSAGDLLGRWAKIRVSGLLAVVITAILFRDLQPMSRLALFYAAVYAAVISYQLLKYVRTIRRRSGGGSHMNVTVTVSEEWLDVADPKAVSRVAWSEIKSVKTTATHLKVVADPGFRVRLPRDQVSPQVIDFIRQRASMSAAG